MWEEEAPVEVGDDTPPIKEQAAKRGWACDFFDFGKADRQAGFEHFNPGLVRRPDGLWLLVRRSELVKGMPYGKNSIWACQLEAEKKPKGGPTLVFKDSAGDEQFEDPRAVYWNGQVWIACVNFTWFPNGSWTGAHIMLGVFKDQGDGVNITEASWTPLARRDPIVGTNKGKAGHTDGKHNKNVLAFFHEDKLHLLYKSDPWMVVEFGARWDDQTIYETEGVKWNYGIVRGGTPPVLVGDKYFTFFHSSLPWRGRYRRYYMGALAFEAKPPFQPVLWSREPLLIGSQNDPWGQRKPLVVFPCGAVMENGKWFVTMGVNDLKSAWIEIPHDDLLKTLNPIPVLPGLSLLSEQTEKPVYEPIPFEEDLPVPVQAESETGTSGVGPVTERECSLSSDKAGESTNSAIDGSRSVSPGGQNSSKLRGRPRKDGLPPGSVPKKRKRRRRKKKALKSEA